MAKRSVSDAQGRDEELLGRQASRYLSWLRAVRAWANAEAMFRSIAQSAGPEYLLDHLAALQYGLLFRSLGFSVSFEPTGSRGPDLCIDRDESSTMVEVTRFRPMNEGPPSIDLASIRADDFMLEPYGDPVRDTDKALEKVKGKFAQVTAPSAIIAVWNSDERLEELEMGCAMENLRLDPEVPSGLEFVVYGSCWLPGVLCFSMRKVDTPRTKRWMRDLGAIGVDKAIATALSAP